MIPQKAKDILLIYKERFRNARSLNDESLMVERIKGFIECALLIDNCFDEIVKILEFTSDEVEYYLSKSAGYHRPYVPDTPLTEDEPIQDEDYSDEE